MGCEQSSVKAKKGGMTDLSRRLKNIDSVHDYPNKEYVMTSTIIQIIEIENFTIIYVKDDIAYSFRNLRYLGKINAKIGDMVQINYKIIRPYIYAHPHIISLKIISQ